MHSRFLTLGMAWVTLCLPMTLAKALETMDNMPKTPSPDYAFDGSISRPVLERYLARAVTDMGVCSDFPDLPQAQFEDNVRMLLNMGAKYVGRAAYIWTPWNDNELLDTVVAQRAATIHERDPEIILQACIFETTGVKVADIPIPAWVFEEFGLAPEQRNFSYEAMLYENGNWVDQWGAGCSVPDMSRLETRMWFYYRARRYIDLGFEGIHFGQVMIMDDNDPGHKFWREILGRVRAYAKGHARRHFVLCDAHTPGFAGEDGHLMFDFHAFPLRTKDVKGHPYDIILEMNYLDSIYGKSVGGITPSGWSCESLPYIVELDNWGKNDHPNEYSDTIQAWGWDEITWFARQGEAYRNDWLYYANNWVRAHDSNGYLQMPAQRCLVDKVDGTTWYYANTRGENAPHGFNQEEAIKAIWNGTSKPTGAFTPPADAK